MGNGLTDGDVDSRHHGERFAHGCQEFCLGASAHLERDIELSGLDALGVFVQFGTAGAAGDRDHFGTGYFATFWNPLGSTKFNTSQKDAIFSNTSGDVVGRNMSTSRALVWPLGIFNSSVAAVTLPLPTDVKDFNGNPVTVTSSYASGTSEDGAAWGYAYNGSFVTVARWIRDEDGVWQSNSVKPPAGNQAYALSAGTSGWTVGKAKFETGVSAPFRAFRLQPGIVTFGASDDLGTLADTSSGKSLTQSSEALELREDYGIVGRSQNLYNVWRAYHVAFNATSGVNPVITQDAALPGLLAGGAGTTWTSAAYGLNRQVIKVGYAQTTGSVNRAVMWTGETGNTITDLNSLLPVNSGWVLQNAIGISEAGFIIGTGTKSGSTVPFLLCPARNVN